jgi:cytochrome P450/ferredoxin-NADP reductase
MANADAKVDLGAELMTPAAVQNPHDIYDRMRAESAVYWSDAQNAWLVTGYHEAQAILAAHEDFMSGETRGRNVFKLTPQERAERPMINRVATTPALSFADQPLHTFHRSLVSRPLAPMQVRGQKPWVVQRCDQLVDAMVGQREPDVVTGLALPISLSLVVRMFGASPEHEPFYQDLANRNRQYFGTFDPDEEMTSRTEAVLARFDEHLDELVAQKTASPDNSFLSGLIAGAPDGRQLPRDELYMMSLIFLGAAFQTTIAGISATLLGLLRSGQDDLVRQNPRSAQAAFNEALRWEAPAHRLARRARHDIQFFGQQIRAGDFIWIYLGAANRDPAVFEDPDRYDMTRDAIPHFGFGNGVHFCAGAGLAQLEGVTAVTALLERFPDLRLAESWTPNWNEVEYPSARSLTSLRVELGRALTITRAIEPKVPLTATRAAGRALTQLHVTRVETVADGVKTVDLIDVTGAPLPPWTPGAHIAVQLPDGGERQFSLCGDPQDSSTWQIAVLHEPEGRGGSTWIHESVHAGQFIPVREPLNNFNLVDAPSYVFIAGGIGITPILPMIRDVERRGKPWKLHYAGRTRSSLAFCAELEEYGERVTVHTSDAGRMSLPEILADVPAGTAVYCCGPERMIEAVEAHTGPEVSVHVERFRPREQDFGPDREFEVVGDASGVSVIVRPGVSIVAALETVGIYIPTSCGEGTCGTCETGVLLGIPEHRDSVLTDDERLTNRTLMPCCSRAAEGCSRLVLDL